MGICHALLNNLLSALNALSLGLKLRKCVMSEFVFDKYLYLDGKFMLHAK